MSTPAALDPLKKLCTICKNPEKDLYNLSWCIDCKRQQERERRAKLSEEKKEEMRQKERDRYEKNKAIANKKIKQIDLTNEIECSECKNTKPISEFYMAKQKGTIRSKCKDCTKKGKKEYYEENKEKYIKQTSEYKKQKEKTDPVYLLERRVRCRIYHAFKSQSLKKNKKTLKYLGCTGKFLHDWLTYQFTNEMSIENYGIYWHIDHVKPCSVYDLSKDEESMECFNWKNLRPVKGSENLEKSDKIDNKLIKAHQKVVDIYLKNNQMEI